VVFGSDENDNHGHKGCHDESNVDLNIGEHDEPSVAMASLQFTSALGASDTSSRIFATVKESALDESYSYDPGLSYPIPMPRRKRYAVNAANRP